MLTKINYHFDFKLCNHETEISFLFLKDTLYLCQLIDGMKMEQEDS